MTEKIPGWLERVLLPRLSEIAGEIKAINTKIEEMDKRLSQNERHLADKIDEVDKRLGLKIDDLDKRLDIAQRLSVLEARMGDLGSKA